MAPGAQRCYYEVLGVASSASGEEIKSSYRRLALTWHPDKNQHRIEEATAAFKEIQSAYEVLSDKHERAWYDNHRESILRGTTGGDEPGDDSSDSAFDVDLWHYFSSSAFSSFDASSTGFYSVYSSAFDKIFSVEVAFARRFGEEGMEASPPPLFGDRDTPYESVAKFYSYWANFVTCKDFGWCAEYNLKDAPNRKVRRLMEAENQKIQKKARAEFNETVRQLASFVKKRDKRVLEHKVEEARRKKEREEEAKRVKEEKAREKAARARAYQEPEWARVEEEEEGGWDEEEDEEDLFGGEGRRRGKKGNRSKPKSGRGQSANGLADANRGASAAGEGETGMADREEEEEEEDPFCVACNKEFRSVAQWRNHERSKKHLEKVELLRAQLLEEESEIEDEKEEGEEEGEDEEEGTEEEEAEEGGKEGDGVGTEEEEGVSAARNNAEATSSNGKARGGIGGLIGSDSDSDNGSGSRRARQQGEALDESGSEEDSGSEAHSDKDSEAAMGADEGSGEEGGEDSEMLLLQRMLQHRISSGAGAAQRGGPRHKGRRKEREGRGGEREEETSTGDRGEVSGEREREDATSQAVRGELQAEVADVHAGRDFVDGAGNVEAAAEGTAATPVPAGATGIVNAAQTPKPAPVSSDSDDDGPKGSKGRRRRRAPKVKGAQAQSQPQSRSQSGSRQSTSRQAEAEEWGDDERSVKSNRKERRATRVNGGKAASQAAPSCGVCGEQFDSRNMLFKHISATGHAQLKQR